MDPKTTTQAARQEEGRAIAQLGRQYSVHQRKLHKLNDQVIAKTREIMDLEERYNVKGQQQVSEAMKAAVRDDNPEHVREAARQAGGDAHRHRHRRRGADAVLDVNGAGRAERHRPFESSLPW